MRVVNSKQFSPSPIAGDNIEILQGTAAVDGDASMFATSPIGSTYWRQVSSYHTQQYVKVKDGNRDDDWVVVAGVICERYAYTDFTDGGSTLGTKALATQVPAGGYVSHALVKNVTGFTGDTSAVITLGVAGGDVDRYNTGTPSVFTTASFIDMGLRSGAPMHTTAGTVTIHVTSAADFTAVNAGALTVILFYTM